jgi:hypothetical protein
MYIRVMWPISAADNCMRQYVSVELEWPLLAQFIAHMKVTAEDAEVDAEVHSPTWSVGDTNIQWIRAHPPVLGKSIVGYWIESPLDSTRMERALKKMGVALAPGGIFVIMPLFGRHLPGPQH